MVEKYEQHDGISILLRKIHIWGQKLIFSGLTQGFFEKIISNYSHIRNRFDSNLSGVEKYTEYDGICIFLRKIHFGGQKLIFRGLTHGFFEKIISNYPHI